jgi:hypothetical protein
MSLVKKHLNSFLLYMVAFILGVKELREPDVWWQLLTGRWILENNAITHYDVFSFTQAGTPWINVKWLYEIFIALIEKLSGPNGVMLLQSIINVLLVYFMIKSMKLITKYMGIVFSFSLSAICVLLFLVISESRMAGRPEMISFLMVSVYFFILLKNPALEWKKVWPLIPLQCLWANMHEAYAVGLVLMLAFVFGNGFFYFFKQQQSYKPIFIRSVLLFVAMLIAILLNPYGIKLWKQPFEIYRQVAENKFTTELYNFTKPEYWTFQTKLHTVFLTAVIVFWMKRLSVAKKNNYKLAEYSNVIIAGVILVFLTGYLSFTASRNIAIAQLIIMPFVPTVLLSTINKMKIDKLNFYKSIQKRSGLIVTIIGIVFYINIVNNNFYKAAGSSNKFGFHVSLLHNPTGAADFIKKYNIKGPAFSDYFVSSYMLWSGYPDFKSYIDLRDLDIYSAVFFEQYFQLNSHPEKFKELDAKYNFNYVVISTSQLVKLQFNLYWEKGFNLVYVDPVAAIFLKENDGNASLNTNTQIQRIFSWPAKNDDPKWCNVLNKILNPVYNQNDEKENLAPIYAALFYDQVQNYPLAINLLLPNMNSLRDNINASTVMAKVYNDYARVTDNPDIRKSREDSASFFMRQQLK